MPMTSRERLMTAFECGLPDRVPVAPFHLGNLDPDSAIAGELIETTDIIIRTGGAGVSFFGSGADTRTETDGDLTITTIETPRGPLRSVRKTTEQTSAQIEFPCSTADDIEKLLSVPYEPTEPDPTEFNAWKDRIGDEGVVMAGVIDPICIPAIYFSPEDFCLLWADAPQAMVELVQVAADRMVPSIDRACRAGFDAFRIVGGEYASTQLGPKAFETLVVGPDRRMCDVMHDHGALAYNHNHGPLMDYLDMLIEIDMDACDCFEAPPWGDADLRLVKQKLQGEVCIVGNLDDMEVIERLDAEEVCDIARQRIEEAGPDGFVLGGTASGTYTEKAARNFMVMVEVSREMAAG
ncbi:MAG: uroporphyrinogen decarboxylase family protein [Armatimonadota bacterium]